MLNAFELFYGDAMACALRAGHATWTMAHSENFNTITTMTNAAT
jgi:hypothetical protein